MKYSTDTVINAILKRKEDSFNILYDVYDGYFEQFLKDLPCTFYISSHSIPDNIAEKWLPDNFNVIPDITRIPNRLDIDFAWINRKNPKLIYDSHLLHLPVLEYDHTSINYNNNNTYHTNIPAFIDYTNPDKTNNVLLLMHRFSFLPNLHDYNGYDMIDYADVEFKELVDLVKDYKVVMTQTVDECACYAELLALSLGCNVVTNHSQFKDSVFKRYAIDNVSYYKTGENAKNTINNSIDNYDNQTTKGFRSSCVPIVEHHKDKEEYIGKFRELFDYMNKRIYRR